MPLFTIETTYRRADFLTQPDREQVKQLLIRYLDERLAVVQAPPLAPCPSAVREAGRGDDGPCPRPGPGPAE